MSKKKLFLLDGMALLFRAHFAFIKNPRITSKGLNTSSVFGFVNTILEIITKEDPSHLAVALDTSGPTFRHEQYKEYKAGRDEMPEDLAAAIPYAYKLLKVLDIPTFAKPGYEADDIIGTLSKQIPEDEFDIYMVTSDKDYAQLVKDNVFLYKPRFRGGGFDVLGRAEVEEKFGVPPEKIIDLLGLQGDSVDNIPGIPKVGPKTAVELIQEFGSVEDIIANVDKITKKSIKASVEEFGEQGIMSKELATIMTDMPIEWSAKDMKIGNANLEEMAILMAELEFKTTAQRILGTKLNPMQGLMQGEDGILELPFEVETGLKTIQDVKHDYKLVKTAEERARIIDEIKAAKEFCVDTETTNIDPMLAEIVGMSISVKEKTGYFIFFPEDMPDEEIRSILGEFQEVMLSEEITKIGQNLKYDILVLKNYGLELGGPMFDTMLAHYVRKPGDKHNMDFIAEECLNYQPVSITTLIGPKGKKQKTMREVELEPMVEYACEDSDITLQIKKVLEKDVKGNFIFEKIEQPLMPILAEMEFEGITIDKKALDEYSEELAERLVVLEKEIYELADEEFNVNSPKQLGTILFDKLELGKGKKQKKTKTGQYVTDEQVLTDLAVHHELPAKIVAYRGVNKLKSTYVDALPKLINPKTGRVHTTFSQSVAVTGRLSSVNPNLQNIPIRSLDGREVRKGFIPRDENHLLVSADYSQVELRIMAAMSQDPNMMAAFLNKEDIHRATASRVFGVEPGEVTPGQRSRAKTVNFGIIYGISAFGLSQRMGISRTESKQIIDAYFSQYPRVKEFMDESIDFARKNGYTETYFGRRRYLDDINSRNATVRGFAERNAINSPIQGTAADVIKLAMIKVHKAFKDAGLKSKMLLQVHDELVFDVRKEEVETVKKLVYENMVSAVDMGVPMEAEVGVGTNWLEAH
ncbi:MAG: DNA polymerase I [Bacteroidetes bacterium]|nr:DNA polymerase I [Bacteroidota bacterium]